MIVAVLFLLGWVGLGAVSAFAFLSGPTIMQEIFAAMLVTPSVLCLIAGLHLGRARGHHCGQCGVDVGAKQNQCHNCGDDL